MVDKLRETGGIRMIIRKNYACLPIFLAPFYFSPLSGGFSRKSMKQVKGDAKDGIFRHRNKKYLNSMRGDDPGPFSGSVG